MTQHDGLGRVIVLNFRFESTKVYTKLPKPVIHGQTCLGKCPIHYYFDLVEEGNCCVGCHCIVVCETPASHEGIEAFELFVAVFYLQGG